MVFDIRGRIPLVGDNITSSYDAASPTDNDNVFACCCHRCLLRECHVNVCECMHVSAIVYTEVTNSRFATVIIFLLLDTSFTLGKSALSSLENRIHQYLPETHALY